MMEVQARHILHTACKAHWEQSWAKEFVSELAAARGGNFLRKWPVWAESEEGRTRNPGWTGGCREVGIFLTDWLITLYRGGGRVKLRFKSCHG